MRILVALTLLIPLTGCATVPTVHWSEPHGRVVTQWFHAADDTHPVVVVAIDGVNIHLPFKAWRSSDPDWDYRTVFLLPPGTRTVTLVADLSGSRQPFARYQRNRMPRGKAVEFELELNKEYTFAARVTGPTLDDWEPIIVSILEFR